MVAHVLHDVRLGSSSPLGSCPGKSEAKDRCTIMVQAPRSFSSPRLALDLIGFAMAFWHSGANVGMHFHNGHGWIGLIVVVIGFLQPFNAGLRKLCEHREGGFSQQTLGRKLFEVAHKGLGYLAIALGILNICLGIKLLFDGGYNAAITVVAALLAAASILPVITFVMVDIVLRVCATHRNAAAGDADIEKRGMDKA